LGVYQHVHQPGLTQDAEVLRNCRLAERRRLDQFADGPLGLEQQVEDLPSVRFGKDFDRWRHWS
jgi:hypothetical protein